MMVFTVRLLTVVSEVGVLFHKHMMVHMLSYCCWWTMSPGSRPPCHGRHRRKVPETGERRSRFPAGYIALAAATSTDYLLPTDALVFADVVVFFFFEDPLAVLEEGAGVL
jgi:hypothetical protein